MFITKTPKECTAMHVQNTGTVVPKYFDVPKDDLIYDCVNKYWDQMLYDKKIYVPTVSHVFELMSKEEKLEAYVQAYADLKDMGLITSDFVVAPITVFYGDCSVEEQLSYHERAISELQAKGVLKADYDKMQRNVTNADFIYTYAFLNLLYLRRGVAYVVNETVKDGVQTETIELVTANIDLLKQMHTMHLLMDGSGNMLSDEGLASVIKKIHASDKVMKTRFSENTLGVASLTLERVRGDVYRFTCKGKQKAINLSCAGNTYISAMGTVYALSDKLNMQLSNGIFRFTKTSNHGEKSHIVTGDVRFMSRLYKLHETQNADTQDMLRKLNTVETGFSLAGLYCTYFNPEASMSSDITARFHPSALLSLVPCTESDIDTSLHTISPTVLKDYIGTSIVNSKKAELLNMTEYLPCVTPDGSPMTAKQYKQVLLEHLTGVDKSGNAKYGVTAPTSKDLWDMVKKHPEMFGEAEAIKARLSTETSSLPKFLKSFESVALPDDVAEKANLIEELSKNNALKITYTQKSTGKVAECLVSNCNEGIRRIYGAGWIYSLSSIKRLHLAQDLMNTYPEAFLKEMLDINAELLIKAGGSADFRTAVTDACMQADESMLNMVNKESNEDTLWIHSLNKYAGHSVYSVIPANVIAVQISKITDTPSSLIDLVSTDLQMIYQRYLDMLEKKKARQ